MRGSGSVMLLHSAKCCENRSGKAGLSSRARSPPMTTNKPKNTDQDLLELAAKAAGYSIWEWDRDGSALIADPTIRWNPLEDDGDALRLAVRLGVTVSFWDHLELVATYTGHDGTPLSQESYSQGRAVATRRAIVRAAAEMGRGKP